MIFNASYKDYYIQCIRKHKEQYQLKDQYYTLFRHLVICCCQNGGSPELKTNVRAIGKEFGVRERTIYNRINVLLDKELILEKRRLPYGILLHLNTSPFETDRKNLPPLISSGSNRKNYNNRIEPNPVDNLPADFCGDQSEYVIKTVWYLIQVIYPDQAFSKSTIIEATKEIYIDYFSFLKSKSQTRNTYFNLCQLIDNVRGWLMDKPEFKMPGLLRYLKEKNSFGFYQLVVAQNQRNNSKKIRTLRIQIAREAKQNGMDRQEAMHEQVARHAALVRQCNSRAFNEWFVRNASNLYNL
ncbi:hypothetical protein [Ekhidna sp.]|uniref:hypothetical protein n=1 Tax=Ekhidna sp. TaxID=2608089 RepID=UPI0032EC3138